MATTIFASTAGPYHIATWAYDMYSGEGGQASAADVRRLLTYAEDGDGDGKTLSDCYGGTSCKSVYYWDPNHVIQPSSGCVYHPAEEIMDVASESWFIHDRGYHDSNHRVWGRRPNGCVAWAMNPSNSSYQSWWRGYLRSHADGYDYYFTDDDYMMLSKEMYFTSGGGCRPWPTKCTSTEEIPNDASMVLAHATLVNAMSHRDGDPMKFFFQQVSFDDALDASAFGASSRFVGITCEGCISSPAYPALYSRYSWVLDAMAAVNATGGQFELTSQGDAGGGSATEHLQRLLTTGFAWLGYKEGHTIVWADLEEEHPDKLPVWPEDLIYPSQPLQTMVSGHSNIEVASGVYRREFATCYQKGVYFGHCAAVVNANGGRTVVRSSWLRQAYHHFVTISGGDELTGGVANVRGGSFYVNDTSIEGGGAILLTP
jgi:hypothetical protein